MKLKLLSGLALGLTGGTALAQSYGNEGDPFGGSCWAQGEAVLHLDTARDMGLSVAALIDRYDLLFLSGQMSPQMRSVLTTRLNAVGGSGNERTRRRVQHALYLILNSPEYAIQK